MNLSLTMLGTFDSQHKNEVCREGVLFCREHLRVLACTLLNHLLAHCHDDAAALGEEEELEEEVVEGGQEEEEEVVVRVRKKRNLLPVVVGY